MPESLRRDERPIRLRRTAMAVPPVAADAGTTASPRTGRHCPTSTRRLHDAVNLATGAIATDGGRRSPGRGRPARERLSLGRVRLHARHWRPPARSHSSPQTPYQAAPEAWLDAFDGTYSAGPGVDRIWWRLPSSFATEFMAGCNLTFARLPAGPAVLEPRLRGLALPGRHRRRRHRHRRVSDGDRRSTRRSRGPSTSASTMTAPTR